MEENIKSTLKILCENHPNQILMYNSYFEAFYPENERIVGGGINVESIVYLIK
jgi:hypothetical protein